MSFVQLKEEFFSSPCIFPIADAVLLTFRLDTGMDSLTAAQRNCMTDGQPNHQQLNQLSQQTAAPAEPRD